MGGVEENMEAVRTAWVIILHSKNLFICRFNRLGAPCRTRDTTFFFLMTPQIHARQHMPNKQLLINIWRIINTFVTKFSVLNRVFCRFNRLCAPCRTRVITLLVVTPQIHTQRHMPNKQSMNYACEKITRQ